MINGARHFLTPSTMHPWNTRYSKHKYRNITGRSSVRSRNLTRRLNNGPPGPRRSLSSLERELDRLFPTEPEIPLSRHAGDRIAPRAPLTERAVRNAARARDVARQEGYAVRGLRTAARIRSAYNAAKRFGGLAMPVVSFMSSFTGGWNQDAYNASRIPTGGAAMPPPGSQTAAPSYDYAGSSSLRPGLQPSYADIADGVQPGTSAPGLPDAPNQGAS
ncbi:MAG: hypothetical protein [Cressdnaviricota sp.]|nr:MAG: hypothetical protein [Cressdnaviricota sp.]